MTHPASVAGTRTILMEDLRSSHRLSYHYRNLESGAVVPGYTSLVISQQLYQELGAGKRSSFTGDGRLGSSTYIEKVGLDTLSLLLNDRETIVRATKARTDNRRTYWILDNSDLRLVLKVAAKENGVYEEFISSISSPGLATDIKDTLIAKGEVTTYAVLFAFASAEIKKESEPVLDQIGNLLAENPDFRLRIEGHTDNIGSAEDNLDLSRERTESVKQYFVNRFGISPSRLVALGYGEQRPIASNSTPEGRARNRRVVFRIL